MDGQVIQRSVERFVGRGDGWVGRYCFSYDQHYDPANVSFGPLVACNEFVLQPGAGFGLHRHAGVDVVTVVLSGELTHLPGGAVLAAGETRVLKTGAGLEHDERNEGDAPVRFVQAWLVPGPGDPRPAVVSLQPGETVSGRFVLVTSGTVVLEGEWLEAGDSARLASAGSLTAEGPAEVVTWTW